MAVRTLLMCFLLCIIFPKALLQVLSRFHVSQEGRSLTAVCLPHESYVYRQWSWAGPTPLRAGGRFYRQESEGPVTKYAGARPGIVLNQTDFSLTIGTLEVKDTLGLLCFISVGEQQNLWSFTHLVVYNRRVDIRLGSRMTLQCPVDATMYTSRQWYTQPYSFSLIFNENATGVSEGRRVRDDMSLNTETFELTIANVKQEDYIFTCVVTSGQGVNYGVIFNAIYKVVVEAEEGTSVTLPCDEVQRRTNQRFDNTYTRTWQSADGDMLYYQNRLDGVFHEHRPTKRPHITLNNSTFSLTISRTRLTDSTMFICSYWTSGVSLPYVQSVKLDVYGSSMSPSSTPVMPSKVSQQVTVGKLPSTSTVTSAATSGVSPSDGDEASSTTSTGSLLPVIGGAVAVAVELVIVITVLTVCLCVRRKTQHNKVKDRPRTASDAHLRPEPNAPDVTPHDATYLPGAAYHKYDEIAAQAPDGGRKEGYIDVVSEDEFRQLHKNRAYEKLNNYQALQHEASQQQ